MRAFVLASVLLLGACTQAAADTDAAVAAPDAQAAPDAPTSAVAGQADAASCEAAGGFLTQRGKLQSRICVHPYADAGKACRDSQECDGKCVTSAQAKPGEPADGQLVGQCQADDALFGCYAEVVDGKRVRAICVD